MKPYIDTFSETKEDCKMKKALKITAVALLTAAILFTLFACGASKEAADVFETEVYDDSAYGYSADYVVKNESATRSADSKESGEAKVESGRKLVRNAQLDVQTKEFDAFIDKLNSKISSLGGYVENSGISGNSYYSSYMRNAHITARVPEDKFDEFLTAVSELANVTEKTINVKDITDDFIDTESRIKALEAEQKALLGILEKADTVTDTIEVYERLSEVNASLERYKSTLKSYENQVSYSKVEIEISEVERITESEKEGFFAETGRRLKDNLFDLGRGLRNMLISFISSLPYLLLLAVIAIVVIIIVKKVIKKRKIRRKAREKSDNE